ncbi:MAG: AAA family ATPase [Mariprofundaceae bacterium]|nr:AAA family ATPase [Mariprofundaceae bacterium]
MKCFDCQFENPDGMKFCGKCGVALPPESTCADCGTENPEGFKFCGKCGHSLAGEKPSASEPAIEATVVEKEFTQSRRMYAERRRMTVLYCGIADSSSLSEDLDPEDMREIITQYQHMVSAAIEGMGGHIAKFMGDGVLAYFGYPVAHEDDPERAVNAGLNIVNGMTSLNRTLQDNHNQRIDVRVCMHTGEVVVGDGEEFTIVGKTPNIAAHLETATPDNCVVVSAATYTLAKQGFSFEDIGEHQIKGVSEPIHVYKVLKESDSFDWSDDEAMSDRQGRFIGRETEVSLIQNLWGRVNNGTGQALLIAADVGMGKTRLAQEFWQQAKQPGVNVVYLQSSEFASNAMIYPFTRWFRRWLKYRDSDTSDSVLRKIENFFGGVETLPADINLLLNSLLGKDVKLPDSITPAAFWGMTVTFLTQLMQQFCKDDQKLIIIVEDLQWMDSSSSEFLSSLIKDLEAHSIFILATSRPSNDLPWNNMPQVQKITVNRLLADDCSEMVEALSEESNLTASTKDEIVRKSDGVPLFIEEMTRLAVEQDKKGGEISIPDHLRGVLTARMDRNPRAKLVLQTASVIGKEFWFPLLQAVLDNIEETELTNLLLELGRSGILVQKGKGRDARYAFRHALMQSVAYDAVLRSQKKELHQKIAAIMIKQFPTVRASHPDQVAWHFWKGECSEKAVPLYFEAGMKSMSRSAHGEAINQLQTGIECLQVFPDGPKKYGYEITFLSLIGNALMATKGFSAKEVIEVFAKAQKKLAECPNAPGAHRVLYGFWVFELTRGNLERAGQIATGIVSRCNPEKMPDIASVANRCLAIVEYHSGNVTEAVKHLDTSLTLLKNIKKPEGLKFVYGQDPECATHAYMALARLCTGEVDAAINHLHLAEHRAEHMQHAPTRCYVEVNSLVFRQLTMDFDRFSERSAEVLKRSQDNGLRLWGMWALAMDGWFECKMRGAKAGIEKLMTGIGFCQATGTRLYLGYLLNLLADAQLFANADDMAIDTITKAEVLAAETGDYFAYSQTLALKARWASIHGDFDETFKLWREAMNYAKNQNNAVFQVNVAFRFAQWLYEEERFEEVRELLADLLDYNPTCTQLPIWQNITRIADSVAASRFD